MAMKDLTLSLPYKEARLEELDAERAALCRHALQATARSYAPYSHFCVGAALELADGTIVEGSNQENAAYPSGTCAERTAAYYAHSRYPEQPFRRIAIAALGTDGKPVVEPVSPCGACRQALIEYEHLFAKPLEVLLVGRDRVLILPSVGSTLPFAFTEF